MERFYKITNLVVRMDTFGRTAAQAAPYLYAPQAQNGPEPTLGTDLSREDDGTNSDAQSAQPTPDIIIRSDWRALQAQQPHLSCEDCEYLCTGSSFYRQLLNFDGMMLHASAVVKDGRAYLFSAPSGTGKSTHTHLWLKAFGEDAYILNDDKPALRREDGVWYAYGTPWSGKYDISRNERVPVAGICYLQRAEQNAIGPLTGTRAVFGLLEQTVRPAQMELRGKLLDLLDQLLKQVPVWRMSCNMDPQAAQISYAAMSAGRKSGASK